MTNEEIPTSEEKASRINALASKFKELPWKKIAIGAAAITATAAVVTLTKQLDKPAYEFEMTEITPEGELHVDITPVND